MAIENTPVAGSSAAPATYISVADTAQSSPITVVEPQRKRWSTCRKVCCAVSLLILAGLITIGALIPFMIKQPTFRVVSTTVDCSPASKCIAAQSGGLYANITGFVLIEINNPSILSPKAKSLVDISRSSDGAYLGKGTLDEITITRQSRTNVTVVIQLEPSQQTNELVVAAVAGTPAYRIRIMGPVDIKWGLIKFSRDVDERYTING